MNFTRLVLIICTIAQLTYGQDIEIIKGHAHNDYENEIPLQNALENGFTSVEVDVYLIEDDLYVSHDFPKQLNANSTIETLYLKPLKDHILKNKGNVYKDYHGPFYLMIDFKSSAKPTYEKLIEILSKYESIISITKNGIEQKGPVNIVVSGNRPVNEILADKVKLATIDGRPNDLSKNIPVSSMPIVSDNYYNVLSWNGQGEILAGDKNNLIGLVQKTHAQNKKLRLWAAPDNEIAWKFLLDIGVDLINTDHLEEFRSFALKYTAAPK